MGAEWRRWSGRGFWVQFLPNLAQFLRGSPDTLLAGDTTDPTASSARGWRRGECLPLQSVGHGERHSPPSAQLQVAQSRARARELQSGVVPGMRTPADADSHRCAWMLPWSMQVVCVERPPERQRGGVGGAPADRSADRTHTFTYDRVFPPDGGQEAVFEVAARDVVLSTLDGYNGTVIAYGQTGTGKTHTMEGGSKPAEYGVIPRACETIFNHIERSRSGPERDTFLVRVSFFQIYNEKITDLLAPGAPDGMGRGGGGSRSGSAGVAAASGLAIRQDGAGETYVDGLSEHIVKSPKDVQSLLRAGQRARNTAATLMNQSSSRSHAVFSMVVERSVPTDRGGEPTVTIGKLNMVDLAGSERVKNLNASTVTPSDRLEEAKMINSSLSAFGKVILALTSAAGAGGHVPYRDSKLTRILQNSLGGNCKTSLITTVSPSSGAYLETIASLKFSYRAKDVENHAMVNQDMSQQALLTSYVVALPLAAVRPPQAWPHSVLSRPRVSHAGCVCALL